MSAVIIGQGIEVSFGERRILAGVDVEVEAGERVALIGANGAGKTTLLRVLAGVLTPQAGKVFLKGWPMAEMARREVAKQVAVVPQRVETSFSFDVLELVLMGFHARSGRFSMPSAAQVEEARQALATMGLEDLAARSVAYLSGGEQQRALMARALVSGGSLWLLDEPTASLDMGHQLVLLDEVVEFSRRGGAVLAILHDLTLVHRYFDRVIVLDEGVVLACGVPDEVLTQEVVSRVYGVQMIRGVVGGRVVWVAAG